MNIILKFKDADTKRKNKGRRKPQQLRQAKARTKQLVRKLTHTLINNESSQSRDAW